jgi:hypothetical protein
LVCSPWCFVLGNNPPLELGDTVILRRYEFPVDP